jgi:magnesium transporter
MIDNLIDDFHIKDIKSKVHPSMFFIGDEYNILIFRLPYFDDNNDLEFESKPYIIVGSKCFYYNREEDVYTKFDGINELYNHMRKDISIVMKMVSYYTDLLDDMEDMVYINSKIKDFNQRWFSCKNDIIKINRSLNKSIEILTDFVKEHKQDESGLDVKFDDLEEHLNRSYRNSGLLLQRLDALYNFNLTHTNEQMNKTVYLLTILSGIFLPLNLIVGFFGMNTTALPFASVSDGSSIVMMILLVVSITSMVTIYILKIRR